jgi:hypothetical protein
MGPVQQKSTGVGPQVNRSNAGFPCAVVYGLLRALPGDRACLPPSPSRSLLRESLNASVGAPGPHDFAVREIGVRLSPSPASTASRRNVRDVRNAPLIGRDARIWATDLPDDGSGIFLREGVDRVLVICPSGCFVAGGAGDLTCGWSDAVRSGCQHERGYIPGRNSQMSLRSFGLSLL